MVAAEVTAIGARAMCRYDGWAIRPERNVL
jgi:hypothetical protein